MAAPTVAVACSGGRDSVALLHATVLAAAALGGLRVVALHVHHGLHPDADAWQAHVELLCSRWARRGLPVQFAFERLQGRPPAGASVEAWARMARYRALGRMAREHGADLVLLAHHRRDQAETFLLQALRGAGAAGLAAMPRIVKRDGLTWARPWLQQPRTSVEAYVRRYRLRHVDDGSNVDTRFARNRLRQAVWPALTDAFEQAEASLADAAERAAEARQLADEVAAEDFAELLDRDGRLRVTVWRELSPARRSNALAAWLRRQSIASAALLGRLQLELPAATSGARWPAGSTTELRLHRGRLAVEHVAQAAAATTARAQHLCIAGPGRYRLPGWSGVLEVRAVREGGVAAQRLQALRVAGRTGGERFQLAPRGIARSLKKQFQAQGVPAWARNGPLLYDGETLVFVPGLGVDARVRAGAGVAQFVLRWLADEPASPPGLGQDRGGAQH